MQSDEVPRLGMPYDFMQSSDLSVSVVQSGIRSRVFGEDDGDCARRGHVPFARLLPPRPEVSEPPDVLPQ